MLRRQDCAMNDASVLGCYAAGAAIRKVSVDKGGKGIADDGAGRGEIARGEKQER